MIKQKATNVVWHEHKVSKEDREKLLNQKGVIIWTTGLSGSGKSTIANEIAYKLHSIGKLSYVLDGDNIRHGLNKNLGFSPEDRNENIRRISGKTRSNGNESALVLKVVELSDFPDINVKNRHPFSPTPSIKVPLNPAKTKDPSSL